MNEEIEVLNRLAEAIDAADKLPLESKERVRSWLRQRVEKTPRRRKGSARDEILELAEYGEFATRDVVAKLGMSAAHVSNVLRGMMGEGLLERVSRGLYRRAR